MNLRNMGITDTRVLSAIEKVPRENFVPAEFQDQAYEDTALPIGLGQTISQPYVVAMMTEALDIGERDKVLEIGTGTGYQTCILAHLCRRVYSIERHKPLLEIAERHFDTLKLRNITAIAGDGFKGWPEQAPFDRMIVTAAARDEVPETLCAQVREGGIIIIPIADQGNNQVLKRFRRESDDTWSVKDLLPVRFVPMLPDVPRRNSYEQSEINALQDDE